MSEFPVGGSEKNGEPEARIVGRAPPASGTRYSAKEIHDTVAEAAIDELHRPAMALWWSAVAAGLLICFSFLFGAFLSTLATDESWKRALAALGYPLGFVIVVLSSTQLFTENTLDPILPLLEAPSWKRVKQVMRLWAILLAGNLSGAWLISFVLARTAATPVWLKPALDHVAETATQGGFWKTFYLAIFAGWLVAIMAWLIHTTQDRFAQVVLIWLTTAPISAFGFRHAIAGGVEAFYRAARGSATWGEMVGSFLIPAVLGNIIGGGLLVALLFYGQVRSDKGHPKRLARAT
jgi:formate/nitrite transporter FocA (FNT family)